MDLASAYVLYPLNHQVLEIKVCGRGWMSGRSEYSGPESDGEDLEEARGVRTQLLTWSGT